jgi:alkylation response protein AidB-like acyl-CoA dehydrogenase
MLARAYAVESLAYRTIGLIEAQIDAGKDGDPSSARALGAFEEFAVEASIAKVAGSEMLNFVLDENIQVHGGNGFVHDYPAERHYRDARVNRIFEGTNEINRLLIPGMLARRAAKGEIALIAAARALQEELLAPPSLQPADDSPLGAERRATEGFKKAALMVLGLSMQTYREALPDQQEVLLHLADMLIDTYSAESALLRASRSDGHAPALQVAAARVFINDAGMRIEASARQALPIIVEGDTLRTMLAALRRLFKQPPINTAQLRRQLADAAVAQGGWIF